MADIDFTLPRPSSTDLTRFFSRIKVNPITTCWDWQASINQKGYGQFWAFKRMRAAHRVAYVWLVGAIPANLTVDHLCKNTACVNPCHMEIVTARENTLRSNNQAAINARKSICNHGHPLSGDNLFIDTLGRRICRACRKRVVNSDKVKEASSHRHKIWREQEGRAAALREYGREWRKRRRAKLAQS